MVKTVCERIAIDRHEYGIVTKPGEGFVEPGVPAGSNSPHQVLEVTMNDSSTHESNSNSPASTCKHSEGSPTIAVLATEDARRRCRRRSSSSSSWLAAQFESAARAWRDRPCALPLAGRNLATSVAVLVSGIVMWESSTAEFRMRMGDSIVFPLYLPHAVSTGMAAIFSFGVAPGNLVGLYLARIYMSMRGHGVTFMSGAVLLLVTLLGTIQSHVGAFYLHKGLCKGRSNKKYPTIDTVADAVWYVVIVTGTSMVFTMFITLCVTVTPLAHWRSFWQFWSTWWLGILAGLITVTPLLVHLKAWKRSGNLKRPMKVLEVVVTAGISLGVLAIVFFLDLDSFRPSPYLCFPLITYTGLRFNRVGWAVTSTAVAFFCSWGSIRRQGALHAIVQNHVPWNTQLVLQVQLFSIVMGVVSITLAAAVREKKSLTHRLHQMNRDLECTVECRTRQLHKTNTELQISQKKAEMASHAKSDFLANMSHEIRTPIHGILGLTALLLESTLTVDQKESLVSVKECADLLLHIINSVLDLAKIEAGRLEVETVPFNVGKLVSSTFRMMQARAQERGLKLVWEVDRAVLPSLAGDVGKLQQCLINLVGNALKFTHEGSISVHVRVASDALIASRMNAVHGLNVNSSSRMAVPDTMADYESVVAYTPDSMLIHFEVRDTGIGINKEKLKDMFKPFTQADASTSRLYGGTGLGLCIVQRFVELLGGTIWVESEVGKGSAFHFCLPLLFCASPSAESTPLSSPVYKKRPWSLMGGLVLNPEYYIDHGAESHAVISMDDLSAYVSRKKEASLNNGRARRHHQVPLTSKPQGRRSSSSDYEAFKELRRDSFHARPDVTAEKKSHDGDAVIPTTSGTSGTCGAPCRLLKISSKASSLPRSDLSRNSSAEMESFLLEKKLQLKILLAEDNPINQKVASRQLQKHGHVVTIVGDGLQALERLCAQHDQFDVVLMDVQMPIMDGLAATEQIRRTETEKGWSRVPILGLTAHAIQGYQDICLTHGMDGYLGKPFDIQQLLKTIGHLLPPE